MRARNIPTHPVAVCCFAVVLLTGGLVACSPAEDPVGEIRVEPERVELPYPSLAPLELRWTMSSDLGADAAAPLVFVHILDSGGGVVRTFDHPLPGPWQPGETLAYSIDLYQSALAPPLSDGEYRLTIGLYDGAGTRWPLHSTGGAVAGTEYQVGEVVVDSGAADAPMFFFSPSWLTLEAGTDAQVLGRRWLSDAGSIRIAKLSGAGTLWLRLVIARAEQIGANLVLDEGASQAEIVVSGTCGIEERVVRDPGVNEVRLDLVPDEAAEGSSECEVQLTPNFRFVEEESPVHRSVALELLSWDSASG